MSTDRGSAGAGSGRGASERPMECAGRGRLVAAYAAGLVLVVSCGSQPPCGRTTGPTSGCASSLTFRGQVFLERSVGRFSRGEELGDGVYPTCREGAVCADGPGGFATDVWRLDGVDPRTAVVGLRQGTHTYVVFARRHTSGPALARGVARGLRHGSGR